MAWKYEKNNFELIQKYDKLAKSLIKFLSI